MGEGRWLIPGVGELPNRPRGGVIITCTARDFEFSCPVFITDVVFFFEKRILSGRGGEIKIV